MNSETFLRSVEIGHFEKDNALRTGLKRQPVGNFIGRVLTPRFYKPDEILQTRITTEQKLLREKVESLITTAVDEKPTQDTTRHSSLGLIVPKKMSIELDMNDRRLSVVNSPDIWMKGVNAFHAVWMDFGVEGDKVSEIHHVGARFRETDAGFGDVRANLPPSFAIDALLLLYQGASRLQEKFIKQLS